MNHNPHSPSTGPSTGNSNGPIWVTVSMTILTAAVWIIVSVGVCNVPGFRLLFICEPLVQPTSAQVNVSPLPRVPDAVTIDVYSSDTKQDWVNAAAQTFNAAGMKTGSGRPIVVRVEHVKSGSSKDGILAGTIQPTAWSPGEQFWVDELNQVWLDRNNRPLIAQPCPATIYAPIGFAMWRPMAEAMGWPERPIGWTDIVALAAAAEGWAMYGHPEWGQFKFGHTHPDRSNSGVLILMALAHAVLGETGSLTAEQVRSDALIDALRSVEQTTYHYGLNSRDNVTRMVDLGPAFLHATNTTEAETLRANSGAYGEPRFPLAFIFPAEGTFWAEHPYCVLDADWVSEEQREAATQFGEFLQQRDQQVLALQNYLRPLDTLISLADPITLQNGTDPRVSPLTVPALASPSIDAVAAIKDLFHLTKKKTTTVIALDTSGSMRGEKLLSAVEGTIQFVGQMARDDAVYIYTFNSVVTPLHPSGPVRDVTEPLGQTVSGLYAEGNTVLYDALCVAVAQAEELRNAAERAGEKRLYAVVLLSDGQDTASERSVNEAFDCLPSGEGEQGIRVFTIAYGADAEKDLLRRMANRTQGMPFDGGPETIGRIYLDILVQ